MAQDGGIEQRVSGFHAGADLFLTTPINFRELTAAIESLARRVVPLRDPSAAVPDLTGEAWVIDSVKWELLAPGGRPLRLTAREFGLLSCLMERPGQPVARSDIIRALGRHDGEYDPRSLDAVVRRLRRKAEGKLGDTLPIRAAHAQGYVFTAPTRLR